MESKPVSGAHPSSEPLSKASLQAPLDLHALRREYLSRGLARDELAADPFAQFSRWMGEAVAAGLPEPNAMVLATTGTDGGPMQRVVLLKTYDEQGFCFFTNYTSTKASQIAANSRVSLHFFWEQLARQISIRGTVGKVSREESHAYFTRRPRGSQLGAWASPQSQPIESREILEEKLAGVQEKFHDGDIPLPDFWGGYRVVPISFEFWQGGGDRLHDRFVYSREESRQDWGITRLAP